MTELCSGALAVCAIVATKSAVEAADHRPAEQRKTDERAAGIRERGFG